MNYKKHILLFLAVMSLLSCSHDETIVQKRNEISFAVRTQSASRGEVVTTSGINRSGEKFNVWGYYREAADATQQIYMNELLTHNGTEWTLGGTRYWPQSGLMDFYCVYPIDSKNTEIGALGNGNGEFDYVVSTDLSKQDDLLYATAIGEKRGLTGVTPVQINFRHALSQIVYNVALEDNIDLRVRVKSIEVCNLKDEGRFAMPEESTYKEYNYSNLPEGDNNKETEIPPYWGKWTLEDDAVATFVDYKVPAGTSESDYAQLVNGFTGIDAVKSLQFSDTDKNPLLVLPQKRPAAVKSGAEWDDGVYFKILCRIDVESIDGTPVQLWPDKTSEEYDYVYVPVDIDWKQGTKYCYTFVFSGSMLTPIRFSVTVDEYQTAN